jgi:predicted ester cyclase
MPSSLSPDQRKALVRHYVETAWNRQEAEERSIAPLLTERSDGNQQSIPSGSAVVDSLDCPACVYLGAECLSIPLAQARQAARTSFPDLRLTILDLVAEGEKVVVRWLMQGTDLGGYRGHPPTGRSIRLTGITLMRMEGNRIVEEWNEVDIAGLLRQLGFVSLPQPPRITMRRPRPTSQSHW